LESKEIQTTHGRLRSSEFSYRKAWWRLANILGYIVKSEETCQHSGLYSEVWWTLTNILGNMLKSGGDVSNILGNIVKSGEDVSTFFNDTVRYGGDFTNILTSCTASTVSAIRTSDVRRCFSSAF